LQWRVSGRWYIFAISYIAIIKLIVAVLHRLVSGAWPRFGHDAIVLMLLATLISMHVQSGEEIGWRGYALPRVARCIGYRRGAVVLGIVWACWHLPQFFLLAADTYKQSFPVWSLQVIALSVAMAWLYIRTQGSLLLMMLMHAAVNNTKDIVPSAATNPTNAFSLHASPVMWLTVALMWIAATYFLFRMPNQRGYTVRPRPQ
jgi:membrane protease YdiL (CAAX protease family)